jgi:hypothetical protein
MAGFKWVKDLVTGNTEILQPFYIPTGTAIEKGEVVKFTAGTGIAAVGDSDQDDPVLGVATEPHDGATTGRQTGTEIKVSCSPTACFKVPSSKVITATGGSATTFVDSNLRPASDDIFNGGYIQVVTCAADTASSTVGKMIKITDYTGSGGTITFATQPYAFASGDTVRLWPGPLAVTTYSHNLTSDGTDIDWEQTAAGEALQIVDADPINKHLVIKFRLHKFAGGPAAL